MITGGTGSFGNAVLNRFLCTDIGEIRIFSRDEHKQDDMRHEFQVKMPEASEKIKFYIGDVRDIQSVRNAMNGVDYKMCIRDRDSTFRTARYPTSPPSERCQGISQHGTYFGSYPVSYTHLDVYKRQV